MTRSRPSKSASSKPTTRREARAGSRKAMIARAVAILDESDSDKEIEEVGSDAASEEALQAPPDVVSECDHPKRVVVLEDADGTESRWEVCRTISPCDAIDKILVRIGELAAARLRLRVSQSAAATRRLLGLTPAEPLLIGIRAGHADLDKINKELERLHKQLLAHMAALADGGRGTVTRVRPAPGGEQYELIADPSAE
jgi:hypothetical protein